MSERFDELDRSALLALITFEIADHGDRVNFRNRTLAEALDALEEQDNARMHYIRTVRAAIANDETIGEIRILGTSHGSYVGSSPMAAVSFLCLNTPSETGDGTVVEASYIMYRGTPGGGWVQNPISYGALIGNLLAEDNISSTMQRDGLDFFNEVIKDIPDSRRVIVGGHSQGANLAEYVTMHEDRVVRCYSFDVPGHSFALRDRLIDLFGIEAFVERSGKINAINGSEDFVNVQGEVHLAHEENRHHIVKELKGWYDVPGMHDMIGMFDEDGRLRPHENVRQGVVGTTMTDIVSTI